MPFSIRPYRRFPAQCAVTYHAGPFLKLPLAYFSGFWLLITLLVLSSAPAYAEWVALGTTDDGMTTYADPDTIRRKGELVKMWSLYDFKTEQYVAGVTHLSSKGQSEYDCAEERLRTLAHTEFSGNMGKRMPVFTSSTEQSWIPVAPRSVDQAVWKVACGKK